MSRSRAECLPHLLCANVFVNCLVYLSLTLWPGSAMSTFAMEILGLLLSVLMNVFFIAIFGVLLTLVWFRLRWQKQQPSWDEIYPTLRHPQQRPTVLLAIGLFGLNSCVLAGIIMETGGGGVLVLPFWALVAQLANLNYLLLGKMTRPKQLSLWPRWLIVTIVSMLIATVFITHLQLPLKVAFAGARPELTRLVPNLSTRNFQEPLHRWIGPFYIAEYEVVAHEAVYFVQPHPYRATHLRGIVGFAYGPTVTPPTACPGAYPLVTWPITSDWQYFAC